MPNFDLSTIISGGLPAWPFPRCIGTGRSGGAVCPFFSGWGDGCVGRTTPQGGKSVACSPAVSDVRVSKMRGDASGGFD